MAEPNYAEDDQNCWRDDAAAVEERERVRCANTLARLVEASRQQRLSVRAPERLLDDRWRRYYVGRRVVGVGYADILGTRRRTFAHPSDAVAAVTELQEIIAWAEERLAGLARAESQWLREQTASLELLATEGAAAELESLHDDLP